MELQIARATPQDEAEAPCGIDGLVRRNEGARAAASDRLREEFGIDALFLKVSDLAKITGLAATSIHAQIREERCPLPHRRVGQVILFRVEDFLDWYCGAPALARISTKAKVDDAVKGEVEVHVADVAETDPRPEKRAPEKPIHEERVHKAARRPAPSCGEEDDAAELDLVPPAFGASKAEVAKYKKMLLDLVARDEAIGQHGENPRARAERVDQETRTQMDLARRGRRVNR